MNQHTQQSTRHSAGSAPLTGAPAQRLGAVQATWLVAEREITTKLRSKAFLVSTGVLLLLVLGAVLFGGISSKTGGFGGPTKVAVVTETAAQVSSDVFDVVTVPDRAAAEQAVLDESVDAAVVPDAGSPAGVTVLAADSPPMSLVQSLSVSPEVELLAPTTENPLLAYFIAVAFGIVFMMSAVTFGTTIAQSVVEEKQTRIVEILLATVSARSILAGKILGNSILAMGQVVAIAALSSVGMLATGQDLLLGELGTALIWFAILFAFGFVLLASLYAALASLVSRQEDVGSAVSPVMWLIMIPYVAIIGFSTDVKILAIMSYVPFSAPVGMPMRLYLGIAEWWEPIVSLGVLLVSIAIVWWLGARIYEGSILRTGSKVKLKDALAAKE